MREIKFRGKRVDNGEWVYGCLIYDNVQTRIAVDLTQYNSKYCDTKSFEVAPETVGQFTGLLDRHGKEIYEEDIYKKHNNTYLVIWTSHGFMWQTIYDNWLNKNIFSRAEKSWLSEIDCKNFIEVIGNIHDNPELIHDQKAEVEHD
jgi:uncharacterized phage protein (TIGR01671 family)